MNKLKRIISSAAIVSGLICSFSAQADEKKSSTSSELFSEFMQYSANHPHEKGTPFSLYVLQFGGFGRAAIMQWSYMGQFPDRKSCMEAGVVFSKFSYYPRQQAENFSGNTYGCL